MIDYNCQKEGICVENEKMNETKTFRQALSVYGCLKYYVWHILI